MPLKSGETLGRYVIDGVIGHGGMGSVYRAHDTRLQRPVALKVLAAEGAPRSGLSTTGGSARILREARIAAKLEHPNIVAIYDVDEIAEGEHAGLAYLAMELVEGRSLRGYVGDASIPMETRVRWLTEVARGLAAAHDRGLVHRDVKPENVVVRADGVAKVLDFGIAKQLGGHARSGLSPHAASITPSTRDAAASGGGVVVEGNAEPYAATVTGEGVVLGTPYYMSPEQMKADVVDARTDQFSWGVLAYELLTGAPPWGTDLAPVQVVAAILGTQPAAPSQRNPKIPGWLAAVVVRAMAKSADQRFASMRDVILALDAKGPEAPASLSAPPRSSGSAPAITAREPDPGVSGRKPLRAMALGALAVVVIVGAVVSRLGPRASSSQAPSGAPAAHGDAATGCTSNVACSKTLGAPAACVEGGCVALASPDCHVSADANALASDSTLWIGSMYPLTGPGATSGAINERATDLARQDFAEASAGLNASGDTVRAIGLVTCDEAADPERAARHLVVDLHVPAIVGFAGGDTLLRLASTLFAPHKVLALTTLTPSSVITRIPRAPGEPPLVWRSNFGLSEEAHALAAFVETVLEPQLRASGVGRTRVALLRSKSTALLDFSEQLFGALRFNGHTALDNGNDFQEVIVDRTAADATHENDVALARLRDIAPNVVLYTGGAFVKPVLEPLERGWTGSAAGRPRYVSNVSLDGDIVTMVGANAELRHRTFGATLPSETAINARFTLHYNGVFGTSLSRAEAPSTAYDGFYMIAYAALTLGGRPATGPAIAEAMARLLPPGPLVEVGPSGIFEAFTKLRSGSSIDLQGTGGALDLDLRTGENAADLAILCIDVDEHGAAVGGLESGLVYAAKTGTLTGKMHCP